MMYASSGYKKSNTKENIYKNFFLFVMGMLISSIAISVFYEPNNVVTGSSGLAIIICIMV